MTRARWSRALSAVVHHDATPQAAAEELASVVGCGLMGREIAAALGRWPALVDHPVVPRSSASATSTRRRWTGSTASTRSGSRRPTTATCSTTTDRRRLHRGAPRPARRALHRRDPRRQGPPGREAVRHRPRRRRVHRGGHRASPASSCAARARCRSSPAPSGLRDDRSGALGRVVEASTTSCTPATSTSKPLNWKRQSQYCGAAGVMNDLGMHVWHVPLRLGWMPAPSAPCPGHRDRAPGPRLASSVPCDTWDNATLECEAGFPLTMRDRSASRLAR